MAEKKLYIVQRPWFGVKKMEIVSLDPDNLGALKSHVTLAPEEITETSAEARAKKAKKGGDAAADGAGLAPLAPLASTSGKR